MNGSRPSGSSFAIPVAVGILFRLILALATVWPDAYPFSLIAARTMAHPGAGHTSFNVYPPAWFAITFVFLGPLAQLLGLARLLTPVPGADYLLQRVPSLTLQSIPTPWVSLALKVPWIIADGCTMLLIYRIVRDLADEKAAIRASLLWWFSPLVLLGSSVLGQYDSAVALFTILAVYLVRQRAFLGAGIAFGLGLALKPAAWVLVVLLAGLIFASGRQREQTRVSPLRRTLTPSAMISFLQFSGGVVIPLLVSLWGNRLLGVGMSLRTRLQFPALGGINVWLIELVPFDPMQTLWRWGHSHFAGVQQASLFGSLLIACIVTVTLLRSKHVHASAAYVACGVTLLTSLLVGPLTQPHYFLVAYPFLAVCTAMGMLPRAGFHTLSIALTGYILSIWGPLFILLPLAVNYQLIGTPRVIAATVSFMEARGVFNAEIFRDLRLLFGILAVACAVWLAQTGWRWTLRRDKGSK